MTVLATGAAFIAIALFAGMLVCLEVGRRIVARRATGASPGSFGTLDGAVFALLGLLVAFTFSSAAERFDVRRQLIGEEANAIGTAFLRLDLLPVEARSDLRESFRRYLDSRIESYRKLPDLEAAYAEHARSVALQEEIWARAVSAVRALDPPVAVLLLPALNEMIDVTTTRMVASLTHSPVIVLLLLFALALGSSLLAGYGMGGARGSWTHKISFSAALAITIWAILEIEYPRVGLIHLDAVDEVLVDLRRSMEEADAAVSPQSSPPTLRSDGDPPNPRSLLMAGSPGSAARSPAPGPRHERLR